MHGPRGAGKLMAVRAACRSIGVHVHVVSGYELRGDTLRRTELRIAEAFKQAGTYGSIYESIHNPCAQNCPLLLTQGGTKRYESYELYES